MTLDAVRLQGEAERRIDALLRNALTEEDRLRADHVATLIRHSLACRLKADAAVEKFDQVRARLQERLDLAREK